MGNFGEGKGPKFGPRMGLKNHCMVQKYGVFIKVRMLKKCTLILGVKKSTYNNAVYYELGRFTLEMDRKHKIFKYSVYLVKD
jgi:hypothetical protein